MTSEVETTKSKKLLGSSVNTYLKQTYPDCVQIVMYKDPTSNLPQIDKKKYMVPMNMTLGAFIVTFRRKIKLSSYQSLFISIKDTSITPAAATPLSELFNKYHSDDGCLYLTYHSENAFG